MKMVLTLVFVRGFYSVCLAVLCRLLRDTPRTQTFTFPQVNSLVSLLISNSFRAKFSSRSVNLRFIRNCTGICPNFLLRNRP